MADKKSGIDLEDIHLGDVFSQEKHYVCIDKDQVWVKFREIESGNSLTLSKTYVADHLYTANQYQREVGVSRDTLTQIFTDIYTTRVFTISFIEVSEVSDVDKAMDEQLDKVIKQFGPGQTKPYQGPGRPRKDGSVKMVIKPTITLADLKKAIRQVQNELISQRGNSTQRVISGYKTQFKPNCSTYKVCEINNTDAEKIHIVDVHKINWLVYDGIKYTLQ